MRRTLLRVLAGLLLAAQAATAHAQGAPQPPHAWLFGTWVGGIFPVPNDMTREACFSQPVVVFTRDLVMRATLVELTLTQREIETVRTSPQGAEFRFVGTRTAGNMLGGATGGGFGCESPNVLHVQRRGENEISFPGCPEFPNPLVRCR